MRSYLHKIITLLEKLRVSGEESFSLYYEGEESVFSRLNQGKIRQNGSVEQHYLTLKWTLSGEKQSSYMLSLTKVWEYDRAMLELCVSRLRASFSFMAKDPYLQLKNAVESSNQVVDLTSDSSQAIDDILSSAADVDLVGIFADGKLYRAFANSAGQFNWFEAPRMIFDFSLYLEKDRAVKKSLAASSWEMKAYFKVLEQAKMELEILKKPAKTVSPGGYRVFLTPAALEEVYSLLSWNAFSQQAISSRNSSLMRLVDGESKLSEKLSLSEDYSGSHLPCFNADGYLKPSCHSLIEKGSWQGALVSARSAKEFGLTANGSDLSESPSSLAQAPGNLKEHEVLEQLDRGIYISNLWYLNYSDVASCRITGMTRFACFWVEEGRLNAPINVMRFDESLYRMLGSELIDFTSERQMLANPGSYHQRSLSMMELPGTLISDFKLTL